MSEWSEEKTGFGLPTAVLRDGSKVIVKVYLSPDHKTIRLVLPEYTDHMQLSFKPDGIIDFKRKV